jgi:hypothetical protein
MTRSKNFKKYLFVMLLMCFSAMVVAGQVGASEAHGVTAMSVSAIDIPVAVSAMPADAKGHVIRKDSDFNYSAMANDGEPGDGASTLCNTTPGGSLGMATCHSIDKVADSYSLADPGKLFDAHARTKNKRGASITRTIIFRHRYSGGGQSSAKVFPPTSHSLKSI